MTKLNMKRTIKKARKTMNKVDWNKTAHNMTSIAGTVGGAIALTRAIMQHRKLLKPRKWFNITKAAKIGAASVSILAGGVKLFNDNMPGQAKEIRNQYRHYSKRYRKMLAF